MTPERWQQVKALFSQALERRAEERARFLDDACGDDRELRREVERLLEGHHHAQSFMETPLLGKIPGVAVRDESRSLVGQTLGAYRVLSRLGAGGMGEVYLAEHARLRSRVVLKVLPEESTADPSRVRRFKQEAQTASALNHPNVLTVHDIDEVDGTHFIATEFVEGETLRQLMQGEKPDHQRVVKLALQIATALEVTHRAGIVHRDIKPENIMVRPDGLVKVLDFGLARLPRMSGSDLDPCALAEVETLSVSGMVAGTPRYMSPEQTLGMEVDERTDIFSFGVVLYEMLAGKPPFPGERIDELFRAIREKEPEQLSRIVGGVPVRLERIIERALSKEREKRYQTVAEMRRDLEALAQSEKRTGWIRIAAGAFLALIAAVIIWWLSITPHIPAGPNPGLSISELENFKIGDGAGYLTSSFSPDGNAIAYSGSKDGKSGIWIQQFDSGQSTLIFEGKGEADYPIWPVWSPDGSRLAFILPDLETSSIWSIARTGGRPELLKRLDLSLAFLVGWSKKRPVIYFESRHNLYELDLDSGEISQLTDLDSTSFAEEFTVSPDEEWIAYRDLIGQTSHLLVEPIKGGEAKQITRGARENLSPSWLPDSRRIAYVSGRTGVYQIYLTDTNGDEARQITFGERDYRSVVVSPDGRRLMASSRRELANLYSLEIESREEEQVTTDFGIQSFPDVSPLDGRLAFQTSGPGEEARGSLLARPAAAGNRPVPLASSGFDAKWSPDGRMLAFLRGLTNKLELWKVDANGSNEMRLTPPQVLGGGRTGMPYYHPATHYNWSPDGTKLAFSIVESGRRNIAIISNDGSRGTTVTSNTDPDLSIHSPFWSPDGSRLAYITAPRSYMASGIRSVCVVEIEGGRTTTLINHDASLRLLGWSGSDLYVALGASRVLTPPEDVRLIRISARGGEEKTVVRASTVYLHSVRLSRDGRRIAFVSGEGRRNNIQLVMTSSGSVTQITRNTDPLEYYSGLVWSPDGRKLFYSKQTSWMLLYQIENFI